MTIDVQPTNVESTLAPERAPGAGKNWDTDNRLANAFRKDDGSAFWVPREFDAQRSQSSRVTSGASVTADFAIATTYPITVTDDVLITPTGAVPGRTCEIELYLSWDGLGPWDVTFDQSVAWFGGQVPQFNMTVGVTTLVVLKTTDGGASWLAVSPEQGTTVVTTGGTVLPDAELVSSGANLVLDFVKPTHWVALTANCTIGFSGAVQGKAQSMKIFLFEGDPGGFVVSLPSVVWLSGGLPGGKSNPSSAPLQTNPTEITITTAPNVFGGTSFYGTTKPAEPGVASAPFLSTLTPTTTSIAIAFTAPAITGDDALAILDYTATIAPHGGAVSQTHAGITPAGLMTTTFSTLTANTSYDLTVAARTTRGLGAQRTVTLSTLVASSGVPGTPTNFAATSPSLSTTLSWTPPTSNGGSAITGYKVTGSGPAAGTPTVVQQLFKGGTSNTVAIGAADGLVPLTNGNKLIVYTGDTSFLGTRAVSSTGQPLSQKWFKTNSMDAYISKWDRDIGAGEGAPTISFTNSGGTNSIGGVQLIVLEVSGLGAQDQIANVGPNRSGFQHVQSGPTGALGQADEYALAVTLAALTFPVVSWVNDDGAPLDSPSTPDSAFSDTPSSFATIVTGQRLFVAAQHNTGSTSPLSVAAKYNITCNGITVVDTYRSGGAAFTYTNNAATSPLTIPLPADGVPYTFQVKATNANGDSVTAATASVFHQTTGGGGGAGIIAATRGVIASNTQASWTNELNALASLTPVGTMSMAFIFQGVAGLAAHPGEDSAWGDWQFYATAGATPRPAIFIYLADTGLVQQPGVDVTLADMAGASLAGTARQINAYNRMNAIASYFNHPEVIARNPIFRLGWEMDQGWNEWTAVGNAANFKAAWSKAKAIIKAQCPTALFDLNVSAGCSAGPFAFNTASTTFWDSFYPSADPPDVIGIDTYADLPISVFPTEASRVAFIQAQLAAFQAWVISKGKPISVPEWGISSPTFYTGVDSANTSSNVPIVGSTFVDILYNWMINLPATGPGRLFYQIMFDAYDPANPGSTGYRGMRNVPVYGTNASNEYKLKFSGL